MLAFPSSLELEVCVYLLRVFPLLQRRGSCPWRRRRRDAEGWWRGQRLQLRDVALRSLLAVLLWLQHAFAFGAACWFAELFSPCVFSCAGKGGCAIEHRGRQVRRVRTSYSLSMASICDYIVPLDDASGSTQNQLFCLLGWRGIPSQWAMFRFELDYVDLCLRCGYHCIIFYLTSQEQGYST